MAPVLPTIFTLLSQKVRPLGKKSQSFSSGAWKFQVFWPQMALACWLDAISKGLKKSRFPGPNPLPLALVMDMHASKTLCTGLYKSLL
jgi:hypothetical protein